MMYVCMWELTRECLFTCSRRVNSLPQMSQLKERTPEWMIRCLLSVRRCLAMQLQWGHLSLLRARCEDSPGQRQGRKTQTGRERSARNNRADVAATCFDAKCVFFPLRLKKNKKTKTVWSALLFNLKKNFSFIGPEVTYTNLRWNKTIMITATFASINPLMREGCVRNQYPVYQITELGCGGHQKEKINHKLIQELFAIHQQLLLKFIKLQKCNRLQRRPC